MKNKLLLTILLTLVLICIGPTTAFADSLFGGTLTLDSGGGNIAAGDLQTRAEAQVGVGNGPTTITELIVTATGEFDTTDIAYINTLINLEVLNVATTITVGNVGNGFCYCDSATNFINLREVTFPATTFGTYAFYKCPALTDVTLQNAITFDFILFYNCSALINVTLPKASTFSHTAFFGCSSLINVTLPDATTFGNLAFFGCSSLISVTLPDATTFGGAPFHSCSSLTSATLPDATTFGVNAFFGCSSLTSVTLPVATTFGDNTFQNCTSLTSLSLPAAITFGANIFDNCTSLTSLTLGETLPTVGSWGASLPASKDVNVPIAAVSTYDPDNDGLWEGFTVVGFASPETSEPSEQTVIFNPQTGEACWWDRVIQWINPLF